MLEYYLTFDIGNTNQSVSLFDKNEKFIKKTTYEKVDKLVKEYDLTIGNSFGCVSSVKDSNLIDIPFKHQLSRRLLMHKKFLEMPVHYAETIGDDRLVNAYFLFKQNLKTKVIIDAGTFTTIDFVDENGLHGGYILPGLNSIKSTYKQGENLKRFVDTTKLVKDYSKQTPQDTQASIEQGVLASFYFPIKGLVKQFGPEQVVVTGGDGELIAQFLKDFAKSSNFTLQYGPDLIHRSLCFIAKRIHRK
jgi:type III pantothenate kinase